VQIFSCFIGEMAQLKLLFLGIFYKHKTVKAKFNVDESPKKRYPKYSLSRREALCYVNAYNLKE
jgi:hypothetical protein